MSLIAYKLLKQKTQTKKKKKTFSKPFHKVRNYLRGVKKQQDSINWRKNR